MLISAGDSARRKGMTGKGPLFKFLDPTQSFPVLHLWIRLFIMIWRLFFHLNARDVFPKKTPTMRGQKKGDKINEEVEKQRKLLINEAAKEPISMLVDSPDPHGVGGTTDTANTGRAFFGPKREDFLNLVVKVSFNTKCILTDKTNSKMCLYF